MSPSGYMSPLLPGGGLVSPRGYASPSPYGQTGDIRVCHSMCVYTYLHATNDDENFHFLLETPLLLVFNAEHASDGKYYLQEEFKFQFHLGEI